MAGGHAQPTRKGSWQTNVASLVLGAPFWVVSYTGSAPPPTSLGGSLRGSLGSANILVVPGLLWESPQCDEGHAFSPHPACYPRWRLVPGPLRSPLLFCKTGSTFSHGAPCSLPVTTRQQSPSVGGAWSTVGVILSGDSEPRV